MWCSTTTADEVNARPGSREPEVLVGDGDRQRTADLLARAAGTGHLPLDQLDTRMAGVWSARTGSDLAALEDGLPASLLREQDRLEVAERRRAAARAGLRGHLLVYLAVMALLVAVWLVAGLNGAGWYPWPLWPALGWGWSVVGQVRTAHAAVA
jgi:hypothetical protein